jgi:RNA recognition motif-containing protein
MHYGMSMTRATSGGRAYSFDETMLPPSALDDQVNPAYSPYGGAQESPTGAPGFVPQLSWGYGGPPDPYGSPTSPLQPRPTVQIGMIPSSPVGGMRLGPAGPYGQNYPATSPGHPIQTTASNKGPDGANLFIFHIPNHYTNVDMYHLFLPYGNLLSVRIMVERETGRSRGFGFVSYDTPEAAAMAIKELNGFPVSSAKFCIFLRIDTLFCIYQRLVCLQIGNKRLKVQHKQIRRHDLLDQDSLHDSLNSSGNFQRYPLPPSGANASQSLWFDPTQIEEDGEDMPQHRNEVEEVIVIATEREVDDPAQPNAVLEIKSNIVEPTGTDQRIDQLSPLATIGQLQNTLPDIPGNDEDPQE